MKFMLKALAAMALVAFAAPAWSQGISTDLSGAAMFSGITGAAGTSMASDNSTQVNANQAALNVAPTVNLGSITGAPGGSTIGTSTDSLVTVSISAAGAANSIGVTNVVDGTTATQVNSNQLAVNLAPTINAGTITNVAAVGGQGTTVSIGAVGAANSISVSASRH